MGGISAILGFNRGAEAGWNREALSEKFLRRLVEPHAIADPEQANRRMAELLAKP